MSPSSITLLCHRTVAALTLLLTCALLPLAVAARDSPRASGKPVTLQLKWYHQFQFAGYYAAQAKGYFRDEGLEVIIREGGPARPPAPTVLSGTAQFSIGDSDLLVKRINGAPIVALAAIFQHSPYILLSRADSGIRAPSDLAGKTVMMSEDQGSIQLRTMLKGEGVDPQLVRIIPQSWKLQDLVEGRVDVISAYATVEPTKLRALGVVPAIMRSLDYGVDFYGDILFTSEAEARANPERVAAFVRATRKGWDYAMANPREVAGLILGMEGVAARGVTREELLAEAEAMRAFVLPNVVEIGHMNPGRFEYIARTLADQGLVQPGYSLDGWIFDPNPPVNPDTLRLVAAAALALLAIAIAALVWNLQMRRSVRERTGQLQEEINRRIEIQEQLKVSQAHLVRLNTELEERVRRRTAELEASSKEMEAFSYSVSHDLRSPLSTIDGFSLLLQKLDVDGKLGERGTHYLTRIRVGTRQMGELIEGLLSLAKLSRDTLRMGAVDLTALARRVEQELRERDPERLQQGIVTMVVQEGMATWGDAVLLQQVLQNLLGNAWKFTAKRPDAHIEFGSRKGEGSEAGQAVYFIRDNGAGFDMAHADKLFGTFQRLHRPADFAGTGIGLAIVQRIISRHNGRIWAEAVKGEGATFYFTLNGHTAVRKLEEFPPVV